MEILEIVNKGLTKLFGSKNERLLKDLWLIAREQVNPLEEAIRVLADDEFPKRTAGLRAKLAAGQTLDDILPEGFALCREASRRILNMRHFDVQHIGGVVLHRGNIAEMATGEGKTLVATLPAYLNALEGRGVHIVTVNDYLARRDTQWMGPLYDFLGLRVGCIQHEAAFRFDRTHADDPADRMRHLRPVPRREAYLADITYGTNNEFGFDYLRDNMRVRKEDQVQRELRYAIVDEVDSILIDEARTPLIISGPAEEATDKYYTADRVARRLVKGEETFPEPGVRILSGDFVVKEKEHQVILTDEGIEKAEQFVGVDSFYSGANMEWPHHIEQALRAHHLYRRDHEYMVTPEGEVIIVDEHTGRPMPGRRWSDGLHQAVESKEGLKIQEENQTLATITLQNYFKMYGKLCGMTGTAMTEAMEFDKVYKLGVIAIPPNRPMRRTNLPDVIFATEKEKHDEVEEEIGRCHASGRPVLVGTASIEHSEILGERLQRRGVPHQVLNAKHHEREAAIIAFAGRLGRVTIATNMAGRGTDILLGPPPKGGEDFEEIAAWLNAAFPSAFSDRAFRAPDLAGVGTILQSESAALTAKQHRELEKVAGAAVPLESLRPLSPLERRTSVLKTLGKKADRRQDRMLEDAIEDLGRAITLEANLPLYFRGGIAAIGGLHIIGTERHESRRIDNQLRGRAGRQGDPGSSQFFLSLEDDLMRKFMPPWARATLTKLMSEGEAIESPAVTRAIERAQRNVEAHNFEIRKQLVERDEIMNQQRKRLYGRRQDLLEGKDVHDAVLDMVRSRTAMAVSDFCPARTPPEDWNLAGLTDWYRAKFGVAPDTAGSRSLSADGLAELLTAQAEALYRSREGEIGSESLRRVERFLLLDRIDEKWKEHLYNIEYAKSGVGLVSFAQVDPNYELKRRATELFDDMNESIEEEVTDLVFKVRVEKVSEEQLERRWRGAVDHKEEATPLVGGGGPAGSPMPPPMPPPPSNDLMMGGTGTRPFEGPPPTGQPPGPPHARSRPFVGASESRVSRNDPCPCGSGKKYKKCHGQNG